MNIALLIQQLRTYCPIFLGNVAGAADYATGLESTVNLPMPACYVYPLADEASENQSAGWSLRQLVEERVAVVFCLDNTPDRRGQTSVTSVESLKYAVFAALLDWNPSGAPRAAQGLRYGGGRLLGFDRARLWWEMTFILAATISEDDGFTVAGAWLEDISLTLTDAPISLAVNVLFPTYASAQVGFSISAAGLVTSR